MARAHAIVVKTALVALFAWATCCWLSYFVPWAAQRPSVIPNVTLYVICSLTTFTSASCAVILLTPENIPRVATNTLIILGCLAVGLILGNPDNRGSYDHDRGGETLTGWLTYGTFCTLVGYGLTLLREVIAASNAGSHDESPSETADDGTVAD